MSTLALPIALALIAGVSVVVQQVLNANLRAEVNSAIWSGFMSYLIGVLCMMSLAMRAPEVSLARSELPGWPLQSALAACSDRSC